jgi:hypothetical protein
VERGTTYNVFRTEDTKLDLLDRSNGRIGVREGGRHDGTRRLRGKGGEDVCEREWMMGLDGLVE